MNLNRIDELADTLLAINEGLLDPSEARRILAGIDEVELSLAEQRLLERGKTADELRGLCKVHMQVLDMKARGLKERLGADHPIRTLVEEHEIILGFLVMLEDAVDIIETKDSWDAGDRELEEAMRHLHDAAHHLIETEKHHKREEEALFPALDSCGITGPTRIMRLEHEDLWPKKKALLAVAEAARPERFDWVKANVGEPARYIVANLRDHIMKENSILYPAALDSITEAEAWETMKRQCDAIGYCSFTPEPSVA